MDIAPAVDPRQPGTMAAAKVRPSWWAWARRLGSAAFLLLVVGLLVSQARSIQWQDVLTALEDYPLTAAWGAVFLAVASFTLYSCFDLLGRRYTGHRLGVRAVMATTFVSYVFNLNLGSLVGGVAMRYRLYSRLGLSVGVITRVMTISMLTNWTGYVFLAGLVFSIEPPSLPDSWGVDPTMLRFAGLALLGLAMAYLLACVFVGRRRFLVRGHDIELPSGGVAGLQLLMGAANWLVMSGIVFVLLQHRVEFSMVVSVLLLAAVAGVVTHIPAGLGVLEAVFVAMLSYQMPQSDILAALVAYRVIYYIVPLSVAAIAYVLMEAKAKRDRSVARLRL
ncbi:MAG: lysylphosphatidylglycerol synthase domain-containing protein [Pseudomonadota bacterium]